MGPKRLGRTQSLHTWEDNVRMQSILAARPGRAGPWRVRLAAAAVCGALGVVPSPGWARDDVEGALGLEVARGPTYAGSARSETGLRVGGYLRWGRLTLSNGSGFITRRDEDVPRGLGVDLSPNEQVQVSLGLRLDGGRSDSDDPALEGLGGVRRTLRGRLGVQWRGADPWRIGLSWSFDALGRGGGALVEGSVERRWRLSADTRVAAGLGTSLASDRRHQTWSGITPEQSARTGYPVYTPGWGWRDASLYATWRHVITDRWVAGAGVSMTTLLGPAADSPLVRQRRQWAASAGLAWRF